MYEIEKRDFGYILKFAGEISLKEIINWFEESEQKLFSIEKNSLGIIIDMIGAKPLSEEVRRMMKDGQNLYNNKGAIRVAVILNDAPIATQLKNFYSITRVYGKNVRYIYASRFLRPLDISIAWVRDGIEPEL